MKLSERQLEVVTLVARDGATYPEVARALGLHVSTVDVYVQRIVQRSGLRGAPRKVLFQVYQSLSGQPHDG